MSRRGRPKGPAVTTDPYDARYVLDVAYSLGCLAALDDDTAAERYTAWAKTGTPRQRAALHDQFRAGRQHERARGPHVVE